MKSIKIEWKHEGFKDVLCSDGARNICEQVGEEIKTRADQNLTSDSEGYQTGCKIVSAYGSKRWMQFVSTTDYETMRAEQQEHALSKAVI